MLNVLSLLDISGNGTALGAQAILVMILHLLLLLLVDELVGHVETALDDGSEDLQDMRGQVLQALFRGFTDDNL